MSDILVLGAGMVGITTAIELLARGHDVTVVDRKDPGSETSYGNAGIIQAEAAEPYTLPRDLRSLLKIALGRSNDVSWALSAVLSSANGLLKYYRNSSPKRHLEISKFHSLLTSQATKDHADLIAAANANHLIARDGLCIVYRDERQLDKAAADLDRIEKLYGVTSRVLHGSSFASEEPAITRQVAGAIHWEQCWSCSDPGGLTKKYADLFVARGGNIETADARSLRCTSSDWRVNINDGEISAENVVIALGPWAPELLKRFGYQVPMILKRGYHAHFTAPVTLQRPFLDIANGVVAASVRSGLRVSSGVSIVHHTAKADPRQLDCGIKGLSEIIELGPRLQEPQWYGTRPFMPDMLPVVGVAPRHTGMWFNFGHGHHGFTLGPTTAKLLGAAMDGEVSELQLKLSSSNRF